MPTVERCPGCYPRWVLGSCSSVRLPFCPNLKTQLRVGRRFTAVRLITWPVGPEIRWRAIFCNTPHRKAGFLANVKTQRDWRRINLILSSQRGLRHSAPTDLINFGETASGAD